MGQVWLAIGGKAYDVTEFLRKHPGGEEVMLEVTGKFEPPKQPPFGPIPHPCCPRCCAESSLKTALGALRYFVARQGRD